MVRIVFESGRFSPAVWIQVFSVAKAAFPPAIHSNSSHGTEHLCKGMELVFSFALLEVRYSSCFS